MLCHLVPLVSFPELHHSLTAVLRQYTYSGNGPEVFVRYGIGLQHPCICLEVRSDPD